MSPRSGPVAPGVAFITGGARGLGNAAAVSFAKEGSRGVVIVDIQDEKTMGEGKRKVEEQGTECLTIRADVTKEEVEKAVAEAVAKFGRIDYAAYEKILQACQARMRMSPKSILLAGKGHKTSNATGILISTKYELKLMMKQDSIEVKSGRQPQQGSIINCASVNSLQSMAGTASYTASKHAVHGITKADKAALEARQHTIRVNAVSPEFLVTNMVKAGTVEEGGTLESALWGYSEARQGRSAQLEEISDVVVLVSTPRMSLVNG